MTLGSLFDGSGGFPLAGLLCGITPVWASEIEPFPIRVTTKRLPFMKHYGDISQMDGGKIEPVDIITFGSPCTDMSIAGRRSGLEGQQSVLFYQAIRIIKEMRCATNGKYPRYICWENVPGAFSSNGGEDFKAVLEAVIGIVEPGAEVPSPEKNRWPYADIYLGDGWSVAYRTLDAQHWGVPQRRKRIFLVADFAADSAGKVLFESEGVSGYSAEGFRSWQRAAGSPARCSGAAGCVCLNDQGGQRMDLTEEVTSTLRAEAHHPPCVADAAGFCTEHSSTSRSIGYESEKAPTLRAGVVPAALALENHAIDGRIGIEKNSTVQTLTSRMGTGGMNVPLLLKVRAGCEGGGKGPLVQEDKSATLSCNNDQTLFIPKAYGLCARYSQAMLSDNPHSGCYEAEKSRTLDANGGNPACNQGGIAVVAFAQNQRNEVRDLNGRSGALSAEPGMKQQTYVLQEDASSYTEAVASPDQQPIYSMTTGNFMQIDKGLAPPVMARDFKDPNVVNCGYAVRRLTPMECARLQGFPDWWCADLGTEEPTMQELRYWYEVFETHRRITDSGSKPKTLRQITKWLKDPHTDAAEYKMWGNGVALPCVFFVLAGVRYYAQFSAQ